MIELLESFKDALATLAKNIEDSVDSACTLVCAIFKRNAKKFKKFCKRNTLSFLGFCNVIFPFIVYIVMNRTQTRVGKQVAIDFVIIACVSFVIWFLKEIAQAFQMNDTIPVPSKRFTEVNEIDKKSGEVSVDTDRLQEMILYVSEVEDWLEERGYLNE